MKMAEKIQEEEGVCLIPIVAAYWRLRRSLSVVGVVKRCAKRIFSPHLQHSLCGEAATVFSERRGRC